MCAFNGGRQLQSCSRAVCSIFLFVKIRWKASLTQRVRSFSPQSYHIANMLYGSHLTLEVVRAAFGGGGGIPRDLFVGGQERGMMLFTQ